MGEQCDSVCTLEEGKDYSNEHQEELRPQEKQKQIC